MVVTVKYLSTVMRADDRGQGGIMALTALLQAARRSRSVFVPIALITLGIIGASLFYGDGAITPSDFVPPANARCWSICPIASSC